MADERGVMDMNGGVMSMALASPMTDHMTLTSPCGATRWAS